MGKMKTSSCPHGADVPVRRERPPRKKKRRRVFNMSIGDRYNKEKKQSNTKREKVSWVISGKASPRGHLSKDLKEEQQQATQYRGEESNM